MPNLDGRFRRRLADRVRLRGLVIRCPNLDFRGLCLVWDSLRDRDSLLFSRDASAALRPVLHASLLCVALRVRVLVTASVLVANLG